MSSQILRTLPATSSVGDTAWGESPDTPGLFCSTRTSAGRVGASLSTRWTFRSRSGFRRGGSPSQPRATERPMRQRQPLVLSQEEFEQHNSMTGAYMYDHMRRAHASANRHFPNGHASANRNFQMAKIAGGHSLQRAGSASRDTPAQAAHAALCPESRDALPAAREGLR